MRRVTTAGVATIGLTSFLVVAAGLGVANAQPAPDVQDGATVSASAPTDAPPTAEAPALTAQTSPSEEPTTAPAPASTSTGQAVAPRPRVAEEKTLAQVAAGRAILVLGDTGPAVSAVQTRLNVAGLKVAETGVYTKETEKAVKHLQWKYLLDETGKVNRATYRRLVSITGGRFVLPKNCRNPKTKLIICVDLKQRNLRYIKRGKVVWTIDIRSGMASLPTRRGNWHVFSKQAYVISTLYGSPMPYSMFFSGGQALHYSMFFDAVGYNGASHGCVNIGSMSQARWLFNHTPMGTPVKVY